MPTQNNVKCAQVISDGAGGSHIVYKSSTGYIAVHHSSTLTRSTYGAASPKAATFNLNLLAIYAVTSNSVICSLNPSWIPAATNTLPAGGIISLAPGQLVQCASANYYGYLNANTTIASLVTSGFTITPNVITTVPTDTYFAINDGLLPDTYGSPLYFESVAGLSCGMSVVAGVAFAPGTIISQIMGNLLVPRVYVTPGPLVNIPIGTPITFSSGGVVVPDPWASCPADTYTLPTPNSDGTYGAGHADEGTYMIQQAVINSSGVPGSSFSFWDDCKFVTGQIV